MSETKHDGKLDSYAIGRHAYIDYLSEYYEPYEERIYFHGGHGDIEQSSLLLDAKQALSLLAWLTQEREKLEQMAKEQG